MNINQNSIFTFSLFQRTFMISKISIRKEEDVTERSSFTNFLMFAISVKAKIWVLSKNTLPRSMRLVRQQSGEKEKRLHPNAASPRRRLTLQRLLQGNSSFLSPSNGSFILERNNIKPGNH
uniref:Uncharacterized protein n=1 Tax=Glossina pallidipes TaxID=7398 RepID=A0A1A9Z4F0_GLOPL